MAISQYMVTFHLMLENNMNRCYHALKKFFHRKKIFLDFVQLLLFSFRDIAYVTLSVIHLIRTFSSLFIVMLSPELLD